jgi:hypothetical protein
MKNSLKLLATLFILVSCAKEEFAANKGSSGGSVSPIITTNTKLCSQSTLVSPQVDVLMLWDNSSSFNVVNSATKASLGQLISNVSENFDYHILSLPLVQVGSGVLNEGVLVSKNTTGLSGDALGIMKTKDQAVASLSFTPATTVEKGLDRAYSVLSTNRSNGIFRNGAYTLVVVISNEDDEGCPAELGGGYECGQVARENYANARVKKLLCLRGNSQTYSASTCASAGISSPINSAMMRFINIAPLTLCDRSPTKTNKIYRHTANKLYQEPYTNGWPTSSDHLSPDVSGAFDSYNLCTVDASHIFDGVNTAIKQTLIKHVYDYWPVAGVNDDFDPDTIRVVRSDGKILQNRAVDNSITNGYQLLVDSDGKPANQVAQNTRSFPTPGEPFSGKMIKLFGVNGNDKIVYPDCLTITYDEVKKKYGYVYLSNSSPNVDTIELRINGTLIPKDANNGWDYMGLQSTSGLDSNLKVALLPPGATSGYILRLNGSSKFLNTGTAINVQVFFNSAATP